MDFVKCYFTCGFCDVGLFMRGFCNLSVCVGFVMYVCVCSCGFCNVWVCVSVGFVMYVCVGF